MKKMNHLFCIASVALSLSALSANVLADAGSINIISPSDDAELYASRENTVAYEFTKGDRGDHIHIWVDGKKGPSQKALKGSYTLPAMSEGTHAIIAKVVDKAHVPTGPEKSIFVKVE